MLHTTTPSIKANLHEKQVFYTRIRIPVKSIYRNESLAYKLEKHLHGLKGIKEAKANILTGRILIIFDDSIITEKTIEKQISIYIKKVKIIHDSNVLRVQDFKDEVISQVPTISNSSLNTSQSSFWHSMDIRTVAATLDTNIEHGLSSKQLIKKREEFGLNILSEKKRISILSILKDCLKDFSVRMLLGASIVSFCVGQFLDGIGMLGVVIAQSTLGAIQQYKSEKSLYSLKDTVKQKAKVLRNGEVCKIEYKDLVPGDIVFLEAGDKVPADGRVIYSNDLRTTEATLTGESTLICKLSDKCNKFTELGNRTDMVYMGTDVVSGNGKAIIVATGINTEIGKIQQLLQNINSEATPTQKKIETFTNKLLKVGIIGTILGGTVALAFGIGFGQVLTMGVSFILAAIPEGLPAVATVAMAFSVHKMTKKNAIVRNICAVEALGATNVICCDKTGTLTMNQMTVKKLYCDDALFNVTGSGYNPKGEIVSTTNVNAKECNSTLKKLLTFGVLCSNASLVETKEGFTVQGDPTEGALITAACKFGLNEASIRNSYTRIKEIPFDCTKRYMTVLVENQDEKIAICKGALDSIIDRCKTILVNGEVRLFTATDKEQVLAKCNEMGEEALRCLGVAYKSLVNGDNGKENLDNNYTFLGFSGMEDPPKTGVQKSIKKCHKAGIKVVMITGDHKNTASAIGKSVGLLTDGLVVVGSELDSMTDEKLDSIIGKVQIFARTSPEQKHRIVKAFKRLGYIVCMTGDVVNDAPAIKEANVGIAMGNNGSDVTKDAASITLVDDDFTTIVKAIEEGRGANRNIKNCIRYLFSGNLAEIITISICAAAFRTLPFLSIHLLWINVISESILGVALASEPANEEVMNYPPYKDSDDVIGKDLGRKILKRSLGIGITTAILFRGSLALGYTLNKARTLAFSNLICCQLVNVYDCRDSKATFNNNYLNVATLSCFAMLLGIVYLPFLNPVFNTGALNLLDWGTISAGVMVSRL